ncbi:AAA family ATPase [Streptomyces sp. enrichment culture]|uniref:AAA family ATPase n=1 Tax=Streptomyces sp. enrichment culture TaxID=1795815 RepID=UPI003F5446A3
MGESMLELLAQAGDGQGQSILIEGAAGMGHSTLLRAAVNAAPEYGLRVLTARARAPEQHVEYGVARQLLDQAGVERDPEAEFACPFPDGARQPERTDLHPLVRVLAEEAPVLLAIDGLQWMDQPSLQCLGYLMARLPSVPMAIVATLARGEAPNDPVTVEVISSFHHRVTLQPLTPDEAAALAADALGTPLEERTVQAALTATGGSPYLLDALFRHLRLDHQGPGGITPEVIAAQGPVEVADALLNRYERAWPGVAAAAEGTALLDEAATVPTIAQLLEADQLQTADAVEYLVRVGLLTYQNRTVRFVQPLVRESVLARMLPSRRNTLHIRAAHILYERGAPYEQIAGQILKSQTDSAQHWTCTVLSEAAREAVDRGAYQPARDYLTRGLRECEGPCQGKLLRVLGQVELATDPATAARFLRKALSLSRDINERTDIRLSLADALHLLDRRQEARKVLEEGMAEGRETDPAVVPRLRGEQLLMGGPGYHTTKVDWLGNVVPFQRASGTSLDRKILLDLTSVRTACRGEAREEAVQQAKRSLRSPCTGLNERLASRTVPVQVLAAADELDAALAECDALAKQSAETGSRILGALTYSVRADVHYRSGDVPRTLADAERALELTPLASSEHWLCTGQAMAARICGLLETGEYEEAHRLLAEAGLADKLPERNSFGPLLFHRARLHMAEGDTERSLADLLECGERLESAGTFNPAVLAWRSEAALACHSLGDTREARRLADVEVARARRWGAPHALGRALRAAGLVAQGRKGEGLLRDAVRVLERSPARLDLARALADLGALARRSNRLRDAREHLRRAQALCETCGATELARTVREELMLSGARPRRPTEVGIDALTPMERKVAMLAVAKQTNREIAANLFVAQRTVELHLSQVYRKLSIPGRSGLAEYFGHLTEARADGRRPRAENLPDGGSGVRHQSALRADCVG